MIRLLAALLLSAPLAAQPTPEAAIAAATAYLDDHNRHDLAATMAHYSEDAAFQLSMGRERVTGLAAITELERFDAVAGSILIPFGWSATQLPEGQGWAVSVKGVLEHSRIFSAVGLPIVIAVPDAPVFHVKEGRITYSHQPPLQAACLAPIGAAFAGLAQWLKDSASPLAPALLKDGRLDLQPATLPLIEAELTRWRQTSGWSPTPAQLRACARLPD
ncbi:MAG: hypothetical protein ACMVO5_07995 [Polymorphobacter sp.]|uniref:hypothetical protein n=1 Tax=Polymorphobacter sp. TaxID=1909290 RepID=UPI003A8C4A82